MSLTINEEQIFVNINTEKENILKVKNFISGITKNLIKNPVVMNNREIYEQIYLIQEITGHIDENFLLKNTEQFL